VFPNRFPNPRNPQKASVFLASLRFWRSEGGQRARHAPPPPLCDQAGSQESAWLLRFSGAASSGEPSGERIAIAYPHGRELQQAVTEGAVFDA